jgi:hypothetical protein
LRLGRQEANLGAEIDIADDHDDCQTDNYNDHDGRADDDEQGRTDDYDIDNNNSRAHNNNSRAHNDNIDDHNNNDQACASAVDCRPTWLRNLGHKSRLRDSQGRTR